MLHNLVVRWAEPFPRTGGALSAWVRSYAEAEHLALGGDVTGSFVSQARPYASIQRCSSFSRICQRSPGRRRTSGA